MVQPGRTSQDLFCLPFSLRSAKRPNGQVVACNADWSRSSATARGCLGSILFGTRRHPAPGGVRSSSPRTGTCRGQAPGMRADCDLPPTGTTTTSTEFTVASQATRRPTWPNFRHIALPTSPVSDGNPAVAASSSCPSQRDLRFRTQHAPHRTESSMSFACL